MALPIPRRKLLSAAQAGLLILVVVVAFKLLRIDEALFGPPRNQDLKTVAKLIRQQVENRRTEQYVDADPGQVEGWVRTYVTDSSILYC